MSFTQAEFKWKDTLARVRGIEKMLRGKEIVKEFDEDLFTLLVENTGKVAGGGGVCIEGGG